MPHPFRAPVLILKTASTELPITTKEVADQLALSSDMLRKQSNLITAIIAAVTTCAEEWTKKDFLTKTWEQLTDGFPGGFGFTFFDDQSGARQAIELRKSPLQSVTTVSFLSNDDTTTVVVPSTDFYIDQQPDYSRVVPIPNTIWPTNVSQRLQAITIEFITGFGDKPSDVPNDLRYAMIEHSAFFYKNRGDCSCDGATAMKIMPASAKATYDANKIIWMAL